MVLEGIRTCSLVISLRYPSHLLFIFPSDFLWFSLYPSLLYFFVLPFVSCISLHSCYLLFQVFMGPPFYFTLFQFVSQTYFGLSCSDLYMFSYLPLPCNFVTWPSHFKYVSAFLFVCHILCLLLSVALMPCLAQSCPFYKYLTFASKLTPSLTASVDLYLSYPQNTTEPHHIHQHLLSFI